MENPIFDAVNPHFKNRYASLKAVRAAVLPPLNDNGITVVQNIVSLEGGIGCTTLLIHESEQTMSFGPLTMPVARQDAQGYGSGITYSCRYALCAIFGVTGEDLAGDDDSEAAVGRPKAKAPAPAVAAATKPLFRKPVQQGAAQRLGILMESSKLDAGAVQRFLLFKKAWPQGCERLEDLPTNICERLLNLQVWATVIEFAKSEVQP
jgi:hypothetical protein